MSRLLSHRGWSSSALGRRALTVIDALHAVTALLWMHLFTRLGLGRQCSQASRAVIVIYAFARAQGLVGRNRGLTRFGGAQELIERWEGLIVGAVLVGAVLVDDDRIPWRLLAMAQRFPGEGGADRVYPENR